MAIKAEKKGDSLLLEINNGELNKLRETLEKWEFRDYSSLLSFMISLVVLNESKSFKILLDGIQQDIAPSPDLLLKQDALLF